MITRFQRLDRQNVLAVDQQKALVLNQGIINRFFPIRIYPTSTQYYFMSTKDGTLVVADSSNPAEYVQKLEEIESAAFEKQHYLSSSDQQQQQQQQQRPQNAAIMSLSRLGRLWSRDSSPLGRTSSCNSFNFWGEAPARMPAITTMALQRTPMVRSSNPFVIPIQTNVTVDCQVATDPETGEICSICLCDYAMGDRIRVLPCSHEYHPECIDVWLSTKSVFCPLCKHDLLSDILPICSDFQILKI
ncbi:hypothetical protein BX616_003506 [Lobosporangium transversale]|nr:hypothetical protein BX616_003506 [Lobosporangium transversale]